MSRRHHDLVRHDEFALECASVKLLPWKHLGFSCLLGNFDAAATLYRVAIL